MRWLFLAGLLLGACSSARPLGDDGGEDAQASHVACLGSLVAGQCAEYDNGGPGVVCGYGPGGVPEGPLPGFCPDGAVARCRVGDHQIVFYYNGPFQPPATCIPVE
jgi:hypothetical protein